MRDRELDSWQDGTVESIHTNGQPLVKLEGQSKAFQWKYVERKVCTPLSKTIPTHNPPQATPASSSHDISALRMDLQAAKTKLEQVPHPPAPQNFASQNLHINPNKTLQNEKVIRDKTEEVKEERSRADELSKRLNAAQHRVDELEREVKSGKAGGSLGGTSAEADRRLQEETSLRKDAERMVEQFRGAKERNEVCGECCWQKRGGEHHNLIKYRNC